MSFFEPLPEPIHEPTRGPRPPWVAPPGTELGVGVAISLLLARTERVAVALEGGRAFSTGVELRLVVRRRPPDREDEERSERLDPFGWGPRSRRGAPNDNLRFGVAFADGSKVTSLDPSHPPGDAPSTPVLWQRGGGGDEDEQALHLWLWPLPPPGPVGFVVRWPRENIPEVRHEVDAQIFLDAAARVTELWPAEPTRPGDVDFHRSARYTFARRTIEPPS